MEEFTKFLGALAIALGWFAFTAAFLGLLNVVCCWGKFIAQYGLNGTLWRTGLCVAIMPCVLLAMSHLYKEIKKNE